MSEISSTLKNAIITSIEPIKKTAQKQDLIKYKLNLCNKSESHKYDLSEFFNEIKSEKQKAKKQIEIGIIDKKLTFVNNFNANGISKAKFKILLIIKANIILINSQPRNRLKNKFLLIKKPLLINKFSIVDV